MKMVLILEPSMGEGLILILHRILKWALPLDEVGQILHSHFMYNQIMFMHVCVCCRNLTSKFKVSTPSDLGSYTLEKK